MTTKARAPAEGRRRRSRRSIRQDVADHIRHLILSGTLKPNDKIPQDEVAEDLGVSRIPVREALFTLAADGFVVLEPYRGASVAPLERRDVKDQFELYGLVHGFAAARAAPVITEETLSRLEDINAAFKRTSDVDELDALDWDFHRTINLIAVSGRLQAVLRTFTALSRNVPKSFFTEVPTAKKASIAAHTRIIEAMRDRDAAKVSEACLEHMRDEGEQVMRVMERNGFWKDSPVRTRHTSRSRT